MAKMLMVIEVPYALTKEDNDIIREKAEDRLGPEFKVLVLSGGATCKIVPLARAE